MFILAVAACRVNFDPLADGSAPLDATWSTPVKISELDTSADEEDASLTSAQTEITFGRSDDGNRSDLFFATRSDRAATWTVIGIVPFDDPSADNGSPRYSADDLTLYFNSDRDGGMGMSDVYVVTRTAVGAAWGEPAPLAEVNSANVDKWFTPCANDRYMMIHDATDDDDIYENVLDSEAPQPIPELNTSSIETSIEVSPDCLTAYFASARGASEDLYTAHRDSVGATWSTPERIDELSDPTVDEEDPWVSADGHTIVFARADPVTGLHDLWTASR